MSTAMPSLRPGWERVRRRWRASPLPAFLAWWGGELRALLPLRWRSWFADGTDWYLLQVDGDSWSLRRRGHAESLAQWNEAVEGMPATAFAVALQQVDREDLRVALLLPAAQVLRRSLSLPLAARDNLHQVVGFEMDRQTPFGVAQVYYAVRELQAAAPAGRCQVELVAAARAGVDPLLARLRAQGIAVDAVDVAAADDRLGVNLLPPEQRPRRVHPRRRLNLILAAGVVLLLLLVGLEWRHNREAALATMQAEVAAMRGDAAQVASLRQQLQDNAGAAGFLAQRKKDTVGMLELLRDATARLPQGTWLERFSVDNTGQIGMQGQSQQAAKLLDALKDSSVITDAGFQGSIQPDASTGKERFYLTARVRQAATAGPAASASSGDAP
ncbi:type II secretion system protein GspL [Rhodanobacter lindaniclasticus]|uniref:Fimbrial assembly protein n=1 Tax=Rhodanobacter lindaniclasticus TaxID=75310 RepID=A0A4S3K9Q7_9GAMM|nr:type II secretion system protein GspL [Rhodanobacter lindaniclasticus]THD04888.1 fimbrial assembly protein [Rhodanobacter lindaniclasticus]